MMGMGHTKKQRQHQSNGRRRPRLGMQQHSCHAGAKHKFFGNGRQHHGTNVGPGGKVRRCVAHDLGGSGPHRLLPLFAFRVVLWLVPSVDPLKMKVLTQMARQCTGKQNHGEQQRENNGLQETTRTQSEEFVDGKSAGSGNGGGRGSTAPNADDDTADAARDEGGDCPLLI